MVVMVVLVEVEVRYEVVFAYTAHNRLSHLSSLVPHALEDTEGKSCEQASRENEEGGVDVSESRAVEGGQRRAARHRRQHLLRYPVQNTAFVYA